MTFAKTGVIGAAILLECSTNYRFSSLLEIPMVFIHRLAQKSLALIGFGISGALALAVPAEALTFAESRSSFLITNFSKLPESAIVDSQADTFTIASDGTVVAESTATVAFLTPSLEGAIATNDIFSLAFGDSNYYLGLAASSASVVGDFVFNANETFAFDFGGNLNLFASLDHPTIESAFSFGSIGLGVLIAAFDSDEFTELAGFLLSANLHLPTGQNSTQFSQFGSGFRTLSTDISGGSNTVEAGVGAVLSGSYRQTFQVPTRIRLVEFKASKVGVRAVPAPSLVLGLLVLLGKSAVRGRSPEERAEQEC
ncbi:MAG: hypothetical protein SNJ57_17765 [Cyanobacteriota bacterium]